MWSEARTYRLSERHDVVLFDRLPAVQQERLAALRRDPEFYGVIVSRGGVSPPTMTAASRDVALLLLTLREPGPLPSYITEARNAEVERAIEKLVLDGILEIATGDGIFVSGTAALTVSREVEASDGHIGKLSRAAAKYAADIASGDRLDVEARLYRFNYSPITPQWSAKLSTTRALRTFLALDTGPNASLLTRRWEELPAEEHEAWIQWITRDEQWHKRSDRDANYKLYVSPRLADLPEVLEQTVATLAEVNAPAFKVGGTACDVGRPDKLVAYFPTRARALECGKLLSEKLAGAAVQGVPFSAEIGADGLVSWGVDPAEIPGRAAQSSWRRWVCRRLAQYITVARSGATSDVEPWQFALQRLRLDGIDTSTWEPDVALMNAGTMLA